MRVISQELPQPSITKICLKITCLKFHSNFPRANELIKGFYCTFHIYSEFGWHIMTYIPAQVPHLLLTRPPKVEGASLSEKPTKKRKMSGGEDLLKAFLHVHESCTAFGATPRRYMAFLHAYQSVYQKKKSGIEQRQQHLQVRQGTIIQLCPIIVTCRLYVIYVGKIMVPMYRLWYHGLYGLYGTWCRLSKKGR